MAVKLTRGGLLMAVSTQLGQGCPAIWLNITSGCFWVYHKAAEVCWMQDGPEHEEIREKVLATD